MKWISKLLIRTASWLSPQFVEECQLKFQSQEIHRSHKDLERLSGLLYSLLNTEPSFTPNMDTELKLSKLRLELLTMQTLYHQKKLAPHLTYTPKVFNDGVSWIAKADFSEGPSLVGRGASPAEALMDFDHQWLGVKE